MCGLTKSIEAKTKLIGQTRFNMKNRCISYNNKFKKILILAKSFPLDTYYLLYIEPNTAKSH